MEHSGGLGPGLWAGSPIEKREFRAGEGPVDVPEDYFGIRIRDRIIPLVQIARGKERLAVKLNSSLLSTQISFLQQARATGNQFWEGTGLEGFQIFFLVIFDIAAPGLRHRQANGGQKDDDSCDDNPASHGIFLGQSGRWVCSMVV